jgi:hypothetical protein
MPFKQSQILKENTMQLIAAQRVKDENFEWRHVSVEYNPPYVINGVTYTHALQSQIIDAEGNVYRGIIEDNGTVTADDGYSRYDCVATFEEFGKSEPAGMSKRFGIYNKTRHTMYYNRETRQVFVSAVHPNASGDYYYSMDALGVAEWLFDVDNREELVRYDEEPQAFAVGIPLGIMSAIEQHLDGHPIDWVRCILAEALGDLPLAGSAVGVRDGAPAFTAEQVRAALKGIQENKTRSAALSDAVREDRATGAKVHARLAEIEEGR